MALLPEFADYHAALVPVVIDPSNMLVRTIIATCPWTHAQDRRRTSGSEDCLLLVCNPVMCVVRKKEDLSNHSLKYVAYEVGRRVWAREFYNIVALMKSGAVTTLGHPIIC